MEPSKCHGFSPLFRPHIDFSADFIAEIFVNFYVEFFVDFLADFFSQVFLLTFMLRILSSFLPTVVWIQAKMAAFVILIVLALKTWTSEAIKGLVWKSYSLTCPRSESKYNKNDKGSHFGLDLNNSRSKTQQNSRHKSQQKDDKKSWPKTWQKCRRKSRPNSRYEAGKGERNHGTYWAMYISVAIF